MTSGKVIIIDGGIMAHISIFQWGAMKKLQNEGKLNTNFIPNSDYTYFRMIIGFLKKIVVQRGDTVIIALDARNSWRRAFYSGYKGQRHEMRQSHTEIDWQYHYSLIEGMNEKLNLATDWHFIKIADFATFSDLAKTKEGWQFNIAEVVSSTPDCKYGIEADDIQAVACKVFSDQEIILVTGDADLDQLSYFDNTKIFSTNIKVSSQRGCYKIIDKPLKILADKIRKGDVSDNIIVSKTDTEYDRNIRELIVNLLNLPTFIEEPISQILKSLKTKAISYNQLPFPNSVGNPDQYNAIYLPDKMISYEQAEKLHVRREKKRDEKRKENYAKRKQIDKVKKEKSFR